MVAIGKAHSDLFLKEVMVFLIWLMWLPLLQIANGEIPVTANKGYWLNDVKSCALFIASGCNAYGVGNNFLLFFMVREVISGYKGLDPTDRLQFLKALCELRAQVISSFNLVFELYIMVTFHLLLFLTSFLFVCLFPLVDDIARWCSQVYSR